MIHDQPGVFQALAHLFAPADPNVPRTIADAGRRWAIHPRRFGTHHAVWGAAPIAPGEAVAAGVWALRREWAIVRLRLRGVAGLRLQRLHRLWPPRSGGTPRGVMRAFVLGGAIAELGRRPPRERVIDAVLAAAGATDKSSPRVRAGRDGSALIRIRLANGLAMLRLAPLHDSGRLDSAVAALQFLADADVRLVPRVIGRGDTAGTSWATETVAHGAPPTRLSPEVLTDVADFAARLKVRRGPITAPREDLAAMAVIVPGLSAEVNHIAAALDASLARLPSVVQHGDFLLGNILTRRGHLAGVVDWETWHPAGLPGVDLLQLIAFDGLGLEGDLGSMWRARPWQSAAYRQLTRSYFAALGVEVDDRLLHTIAVAWWANRVKVLRRRPERRPLFDDPGWVESNVAVVLRSIYGGLGLDGGPTRT